MRSVYAEGGDVAIEIEVAEVGGDLFFAHLVGDAYYGRG